MGLTGSMPTAVREVLTDLPFGAADLVCIRHVDEERRDVFRAVRPNGVGLAGRRIEAAAMPARL